MIEPDRKERRRQRLRNVVQALLLFGGIAGVLGVVAWLLFGPAGLVWALGLGVLAAVSQPQVPAGWVLRMFRATPLPEHAAPTLHRYLRILCERAGLDRPPRLYYIASPVLNAMALGHRDDAVLTVTDGLLRNLSSREVAGVLAHEVAHIRANDLWIMNLSDTVGRLAHMLAYLGLFALLLTVPATATGTFWPLLIALVLAVSPTVVTLLQLALARSREYDADLEAASLTGDPEGLAAALQTLERQQGRLWERLMAPRGGGADPLLLRTHPPTDERVERLRSLVAPRERRQLGDHRSVDDRGRPAVERPARLRFPGVRW